jgi:mannose-6-phosphate isomerase-like protein (cupin superfamily)
MKKQSEPDSRSVPPDAILLEPDAGRSYTLGRMRAVFKADGAETSNHYSVSEWWLEPHTAGPGAHLHEANDEVFYVIEGSPSLLIGDNWITASRGSFIRIPAGVMHDFQNRSGERAGLLNFFIPGGFEKNMPAIVEWFRQADRT